MDGVSALALVCNVLQVAEYSYKLVSKASELSHTPNGTLPINQDTETCAKELLHRNLKLEQSLEQGKDSEQWDDDDAALEALGRDCNDLAVRLIDRLKRLESREAKRSMYRSVRQALKAVASKDELNAIAERMKAFQDQINSRIIQSTGLRLKLMEVEHMKSFRELEEGERRILALSKLHQRQLTDQINSQTDYLQRLIESQIQNLGSQLLQANPFPGLQTYPGRSGSPVPPYTQAGVAQGNIWELVRQNNKPDVQALLYQDPSAVKARDQRGRTALHEAASMGNEKLVAYLIRNDAIVNAEDAQDLTPLHLAVKSNSIAATRLLLLRGGDADAEDSEGNRPLAYADIGSEVAWALQYGHHVDATDRVGDTALHLAARTGDIKMARSLLGQRANVLLYNNRGLQPLHDAVMKRGTGIPNLLLEAGADAKAITKNERKDTVLGLTCQRGDLATATRLLELGAGIDVLNVLDYSPLSEACHAIRFSPPAQDIAVLLVEKGANLYEADGRGYKPLHVACFNGGKRVVEAITKTYRGDAKKIVNEASRATQWTPLAEAAEHGHIDIVRLLLECGADPNGNQNSRPLCNTAIRGHVEIANLLLEQRSIDINCVEGAHKYTPIIDAARHGHVEVLRTLLAKKPDVRLMTTGQHDALALAAIAGKADAIRVLVKEGRMDVNHIPAFTHPPLSQAVKANQPAAVEVLIALGADLNLTDQRMNYAPVHLANMDQNPDNEKILSILLEHKANPNVLNVNGWTALHETAHRGFPKRVEMLLEAGADPTIRTWESTPYKPHRNLTPREMWERDKPEGWKQAVKMLQEVETAWTAGHAT